MDEQTVAYIKQLRQEAAGLSQQAGYLLAVAEEIELTGRAEETWWFLDDVPAYLKGDRTNETVRTD